MTTTVDAFIGKFSQETRKDLSQIHGMCWDEDEVVSNCRACQVEFTSIIRRHHCRDCGGIYCDTCAPLCPTDRTSISAPTQRDSISGGDSKSLTPPSNKGWYPGKFLGRKRPTSLDAGTAGMDTSESGASARSCIGCRLGETPGETVRGILMDMYICQRDANADKPPAPPATCLDLVRGSQYGNGDKVLKRTHGLSAHRSGYIELLNKGDFVCAVRMFYSGSEIPRECCRSSYMILLPQQVVHAEFDPSAEEIIVATLFANNFRYEPNSTPVYNTRGPGVTKQLISPSCLIENFSHISIYSVKCGDCNVILKYQGQGVVELRRGTSTKLGKTTFGVFRSVLGNHQENAAMDMSTNASEITRIFTSFEAPEESS